MYTDINGMRSARYPLQGLGCNCGGPAAPIGQAPGADTIGVMLPVIGLAGLVLWLGMSASSGGHHVKSNRRRRR